MNSNYLVVGSGLFGAVFAHEAAKRGNKVTVLEKEIILQATSILMK